MPGQSRARYLICYDIEDDKKRHKLAEMLLDYGDRLQLSVFEADLSENELKTVLDRAKTYVDKNDSFRVYFLCMSCLDKVRTLGRPFYIERDGARII